MATPRDLTLSTDLPVVKLASLDYDRCIVEVNGVRFLLRRDRREDLIGEALECFNDDQRLMEAVVAD